MRTRAGRVPVILAVALIWCAATLTSCALHGQQFVQDRRVHINAPRNLATVELPTTIRWSAPALAGTGTRFVVFVDGTPQPPGQPLTWLARQDKRCRADEGCPDASWFAARDVYATSAMSLVITRVPYVGGGASQLRGEHTATLILLDAGGRRAGQSAFSVNFKVKRR